MAVMDLYSSASEPTRFWTRPRVNRLSVAVILAVVMAIPLGLIQSRSQDGSAIREGDFMQSYSAAVMIHKGMGRQLYDYDLQSTLQAGISEREHLHPGFTPFPYPPHFALFLSPLGGLPFHTARLIWVGVMLLFFIASLYLGAGYAPVLKQNYLATAAFFISCSPILVGVLGAQNVALSMFCYSGALWALSRKNPRGEFLCGFFLGLWLFKPQYALIVICFFVFSRSWKIIFGAFMAGAVSYVVGAAVSGWSWPLALAARLPEHSALCRQTLLKFMISIPAFFEACGLKHIGIALVIIFTVWLIRIFWKNHNNLGMLLVLAGPAALLISPQPLFYDFGICLLPLARHLKFEKDNQSNGIILLSVVVFLATMLRQEFPIQPLFPVLLGIFIYLYKKNIILRAS